MRRHPRPRSDSLVVDRSPHAVGASLPRALARATAVAAIVCVRGAGAFGCDSGGTECECVPTGLTVRLPEALVGHVSSFVPSGLACDGAIVAPTPTPSSPASLFHVEPTQPGPCHLDVFFSDGTTFAADVTVVETTGCCAGLRTSPPGAADVDVPAPDDGGVAGGLDADDTPP